MVRISVDVVNDSYQFVNAARQREISLRNLQIPTIENLGVTRDQFDVIDLSDNNIRKLDNLPQLKRLECLLLHNNHVQQIDAKIGEQLPNLNTLALTNNNICELGDIEPLAGCTKLEYLTLIGNPLTHKPHYRQYVIFKLRTVRVIDFRRVKLAERKAANKLFKGTEGEKLRKEVVKESKPLAEDEQQLTSQNKSSRTIEEQEKLKKLISGARTLTEVENLQSMLQTGRITEKNGGGVVDNQTNDDDEEEEEEMEL